MDETHRIVVRKVRKALKEIDPQVIVAHLEELRAANGGLLDTAQMVEANRKQRSLLHGCFTWDDAVCGERYRRIEAATIVRAVRIYDHNTEIGRKYEAVRIFTDDGGKLRRGYMDRDEIAASTTLKHQVVKTALRQLLALKRRFRNVSELAGIWSDISEAAESHGIENIV